MGAKLLRLLGSTDCRCLHWQMWVLVAGVVAFLLFRY